MKNIILSLLEISVYASVLILAVFAIKTITQKKISAKLIHLLWLVVLVRLVMPITLDSPIHVNITQPVAINAPIAESPVYDVTSANFHDSASDNSLSSAMNDITAKNNALPVIDVYLIAFTIWALVAFLFATATAVRITLFKHKLKQLNMTDDYKAQLEAAKKEIDIKQEIRIALSEHTDIPFVFGAIKPIIVIPKHFKKTMTDTKLSYIILHELCHVKRHDILVNFVWLFARAIHWFNPLAHIAYKSYLDSADRACDETVSHNMHYDEKCEYSQSLIDVMRHAKRSYNPSLALSLCRNKSTLSKRIENIIHPKKKSKTALIAMIIAVSMIVIACFTTACQPKEPSTEELHPTQSQQDINSETEKTVASEALVENQTADALEITKSEAKQLIKNLPLRQPQALELLQREDYFGDSLAYFICDDGLGVAVYRFLDNSKKLVAYGDKSVEMTLPYELSDDEYMEIALEFARKIWGYENVEFISRSKPIAGADYGIFDFCINGLITEINQKFSITLNGRGELRVAASYPKDVDLSKGIPVETAKETALQIIKEHAHIIDENKLVIISEELSMDFAPLYILKYEYRSENPTVEEFDYDAEIYIRVATGETSGNKISPITDNIDVYQIDEAEQMAKEYIAQEKYSSSDMWDRFTTLRKYTGVDNYPDKGQITYSFTFLYSPKEETDEQDERSYTIIVTAAGEFGDIG